MGVNGCEQHCLGLYSMHLFVFIRMSLSLTKFAVFTKRLG